MMNDSLRRGQADAGLCARCSHGQTIESSRGSTFYLCRLSAVDPGFPKYPRIPVIACPGFRPVDEHDK
jgi:hypothetical protein